MKYILKIKLIILTVLLVGCGGLNDLSELEDITTYEISFINNSSFDIEVSDNYGNDFESFTVLSGSTYILNYEYSTFLETISYTNSNKVLKIETDTVITFSDDPYWDYDSSLNATTFSELISLLETETNITRDLIDKKLDEMKVKQNYDYSYYDGTGYVCHSLDWQSYNSTTYDWNYYRQVDIWVNDSGTLEKDMCSYYQGD